MERLTKVMSCPNGTKIYDISNKLFGLNTSRADKTRMILEKLAEYEDLDEQNRLIRLPCKVGDTVYLIDRDENNKFKVYEGKWKRISLIQESKDGSFNLRGEISYDIYDCFYDDGRTMKRRMYVGQEHTEIGKVVFLTKPEAEIKLKELRGKENESSN
jgi:hypothetical protein